MEQQNVTAAQLGNYDIYALIDCSGSMGTTDMPNGKSRWNAAEEGTIALASKAIQYDQNGITVGIFHGNTAKLIDNVNSTDIVKKIFSENEPSSGTPTDKMLEEVFKRYFDAKAAGQNPKPILIAVVTDGEPNDRPATKRAIVEATKKMSSDGEIGISFLQIGNDSSAANFLQDLDDNLTKEGATFDIVDTKKLEDVENITETLVAALND